MASENCIPSGIAVLIMGVIFVAAYAIGYIHGDTEGRKRRKP